MSGPKIDVFAEPTPRQQVNLADAIDRLDRALLNGNPSKIAQILQAGGEPPSLKKIKGTIARVSKSFDSRESLDKAATNDPGTPKMRLSTRRSSIKTRLRDTTDVTGDAPIRMRYDELQTRHEELQRKYEALEKESTRSMEANLRRISKLQAQIEELQHALKETQARRAVDPQTLRSLNTQIQEGVNELKARTARVLKEHEYDLIRSFRTRLLDVQRELHVERSKQDETALEWIQKAQELQKKLDWAKEEALRLDGLNQQLTKENNKLRMQFKAQEGDRSLLVNQIVGLKREVAMQQQHMRHSEERELSPIPSSPAPDASLTLTRSALELPVPSEDVVRADKWRDEVRRLRTLLEAEKQRSKKARAAHVTALAERTELQAFLRQCISDVVAEITEARQRAGAPPSRSGPDVAQFGPGERARVLELLLSKERVVSLLYDKTFPNKYNTPRQDTTSDTPRDNSAEKFVDQLAEEDPYLNYSNDNIEGGADLDSPRS